MATLLERSYRGRARRERTRDAELGRGELNIVPFLDIVMNILMFVLVASTSIYTARIPVPAPRVGPGHESTAATVQILREGYVIGTPSGFLQPGCQQLAAARVAVPLRGGRHDTAGLTRCLQVAREQPALREQFVGQRTINISTVGELPYQDLIETLDAVRETRPGANDLFTDPVLGSLR